MRKLREKVKNDPALYEEHKKKERERYKARKEAGKIKSIEDLSEREQRNVRKQWRERSKRSYHARKNSANMERTIQEYTPPSTPTPEEHLIEPVAGPSRQAIQGRIIQRKNREHMREEIDLLKQKLLKAERRIRKYKTRLNRNKMAEEKAKPETPNKRVRKLLKGQIVTPVVKRNLLINEVIQDQLRMNYDAQTTPQGKRKVVKSISGKVVQKYRLQHVVSTMTSKALAYRRRIATNRRRATVARIKKNVEEFFQEDQVSRMCPGKKDTVTFRKIKKQKRYLNDNLKNLYQSFKAAHPEILISYSTFCKYRPFWVLEPNYRLRETCMCIVHDNMALMITKLRSMNIINPISPSEMLKEICCDSSNEECLGRICNLCKLKEMKISEYDDTEMITYEKWGTTRVEVMIKGEKKLCQKTIKEKIQCTKKDLVSEVLKATPSFLSHVRNIVHQYRSIDRIKRNLALNEVLVHIDFSENYICKYAQEIQSVHFGGSKQQISLHTVVFYYRPEQSSSAVPVSLCTLSENLRHDPGAICAHLEPIIAEIIKLVPQLKVVHFLSDGPSTQYKNKKMFYLIASYLSEKLNVDVLRWHYSESGHGKGAPDGVGATLKRTADKLVGQGKDISTFKVLVDEITRNCKGIKCIPVTISSFFDTIIPENLRPFKGTMAVRELVWQRYKKYTLQARKLSCVDCLENCDHFGMGSLDFSYIYETEKGNNYQGMNLDPICSQMASKDTQQVSPSLKERQPKPSRLHYSDVYSSDDEIQNKRSFSPTADDYVVVRLRGKKVVKNFVGFVLRIDDNEELTVKFMKKCGFNRFIFPDKDDTSVVMPDEIVCVLNSPCLNKKDEYSFTNLPKLENLY